MKNKVHTIYQKAERFAEITKQTIVLGNIKRTKKCFEIASRLLENGNLETQNAMSNVYIFSVSTFLEIHHYNMNKIFPKNLQSEYIKQINTSGI